jgi:hypothetical protein
LLRENLKEKKSEDTKAAGRKKMIKQQKRFEMLTDVRRTAAPAAGRDRDTFLLSLLLAGLRQNDNG